MVGCLPRYTLLGLPLALPLIVALPRSLSLSLSVGLLSLRLAAVEVSSPSSGTSRSQSFPGRPQCSTETAEQQPATLHPCGAQEGSGGVSTVSIPSFNLSGQSVSVTYNPGRGSPSGR